MPQNTPAPATFDALGVPTSLTASLTSRGIAAPFPIQAATLPDTLAGRDVLGRGRTGSGKTLAFAAAAGGPPRRSRPLGGDDPGRSQPGHPRGLVLAPTRELATQIAETVTPLATAAGLKVMTIFGGGQPDPAGRDPAPRRRHRRRHPRPARGPHGPAARHPRRRRRHRARRGRPHGRPRVPARRHAHPAGHPRRHPAAALLGHPGPRVWTSWSSSSSTGPSSTASTRPSPPSPPWSTTSSSSATPPRRPSSSTRSPPAPAGDCCSPGPSTRRRSSPGS